MKKATVIFLVLLVVWGWSFYATREAKPAISKQDFSENKKTTGDIYLQKILQYDRGVETDICSADSKEFAKGFVSLTFDDGWKEIYQNAIPILNQAGIRSTQYISTQVIKDSNK